MVAAGGTGAHGMGTDDTDRSQRGLTSSIDLGIPDLADVEQLGRGGSSVVYAATDVRLYRRVAVKILGQLAKESDRRRFDRESRASWLLDR
jgi:hypothetical protein